MAKLENLKNSLKNMDFDHLQHAVRGVHETREQGVDTQDAYSEEAPILTLKDTYQVTFQDPSKPEGTGFKRYPCLQDDTFYLVDVRKTSKNLIFIFEGGPNVRRNMRKHAVGPGLTNVPTRAEFTLAMMNETRMIADSFLNEVIGLCNDFSRSVALDETIDRGEVFGSW